MKHRFYADTKYIKSASIGAFTQMIFFFSFLSKHRERETFKKWRICEKIRKANGREKKNIRLYFMPDGYLKIKRGYKFE